MKKFEKTQNAIRYGTVALLSLATLGGCSSDDGDDDVCEDTVATAADDDAPFDDYKTFAVVDVPRAAGGDGGAGANLPDDIVTNIEAANDEAAKQLEDLGLDEVDADDDPDLLIISAAATETEEGTYWSCVPGWYWWGWYYYWDPCAWIAPIDFEYTEGSLLVALVDAEEEKPVFGGLVQGILECTDEGELDDRIQAGVASIFEDYPE